MKWAYARLLAVVAVIFALFLVNNYYPDQEASRVCIRDSCFEVELATTSAVRAKGLMYRESLAEDRGMLFVYNSEGMYQFWMKNTLIPLDMIWISQDGKIVNIKRSAQPCQPDYCPTINPGAESQYVLEINGGLSERLGFEVGDDVTISL
jgi:uncharacterized membrane protein (UPF0127 family)